MTDRRGGGMQMVTVVDTSPLTVRETVASSVVDAQNTFNPSYAPASGDRVLATFCAGVYWIHGPAT